MNIFSDDQVDKILTMIREERALDRARIVSENALQREYELARATAIPAAFESLLPKFQEMLASMRPEEPIQ